MDAHEYSGTLEFVLSGCGINAALPRAGFSPHLYTRLAPRSVECASKVARAYGVRRQSAAATALWAARGLLVLADHRTGFTTERCRASLATALHNVGHITHIAVPD